MGRFTDRPDHILGDLEPHAVVRDVAAGEVPRLGSCGLTDAYRRCRSHGTVDMLARDAPVPTGALDARRIDVVLHQRTTDGGRQPSFQLAASRLRGRSNRLPSPL